MKGTSFVEMLENTSTQRYLRATPFSISDGVDFNGKLSDKFFFDKLYYNTQEAQEEKNRILQDMSDNADSVIVLIGYSGCGKTTFLHYLLNEQKDKMYLFDFEKGIDNQQKEPILLKLRNEFCDLLVNDILTNNYQVLKSFYNIFYFENFKNHRLIISQVDVDRKIEKLTKSFFEDHLFDSVLKKVYEENDEQSKIIVDQMVSKYVEDMDYLQILGLYILWDVVDDILKCQKNPRHHMGAIFCFDNMDNIDSTDVTKSFIKHFAQFHINIRDIFKKIDLEKYNCSNIDLLDNYTYIISYRETTYAKLTEHLNESTKFIYMDKEISDLYDKKLILKKRRDFLEENKSSVPKKLYDSVNKVDRLLENKYIENNVFPLFNNNYNIAVKTTCKICEEYPKYTDEFINLVNKDNGRFTRGANGLILKLYFDYFKGLHYYEKIQLFDFHSDNSAYLFSPARLILTYINNKNGNACMYDIYEFFKDIISPEDITKIIYEIYLLRFSHWRHLLTFTKFPPTKKDELQSQLDLYHENKPISQTRHLYSTLEITPAGKIYLKTMCTHFEFYSSRLFGNRFAPLFSYVNLRKQRSLPKYRIIIRGVYNNVRKCLERLSVIDNTIMRVKNITKNQYYNSDYVSKSMSHTNIGKQFHGERIIFAHIGYINEFRQFLLTTKLSYYDKVKSNKYIANYIIKYLELYDSELCIKSSVNEKVYENLLIQAQTVYNNPEDFNTLIETESYKHRN